MTMEEAVQKTRVETQGLTVLLVCALVWVFVRMVSDLRFAPKWGFFLTHMLLLILVVTLRGLHSTFVKTLTESVTDSVQFVRVFKVVSRIEGLAVLAIFSSLGVFQWGLR